MRKQTINKKLELSAQQFETAIANYSIAEKREIEIRLAIENEISELLDKYKDELECLSQARTKAFELAHSYCVKNKDLLFGKRRSIATMHGFAGFRLGTPRLKVAKGSNWKDMVCRLKEKLPLYLRTIEEPAKDLLLIDRHKENVAPILVELGIEVVQEELFYIECKRAA